MGIRYVKCGRLRKWRLRVGALVAFVVLGPTPGLYAQEGSQPASVPRSPLTVGTIKSISGNSVTLNTDAGAEVQILVAAETRLQRVPPGSKDLKEAVPIQMNELQAGDRILVRTKPGEVAGTLVATSLVAMKKGDIAEKQSHEREDWQRRGIGGLVRGVDASSGVVTIGTMTPAESKDVAIHTSKVTVIRRYTPGSVKFDEAKPSTLAEIGVGDQVRARGTRSPDGLDFTAEEIVSGAFRNIAGTILAVDASAGTMTVSDPATKKNVEVKLTADSQLRKLPQPMAQRIAMRLKGGPPDANATGTAKAEDATAKTSGGGSQQGAAGAPSTRTGGPPNGAGRQGGGDLQQMLSRLPANTLSDFQKGDAVMIVATGGQQDSWATAITLLGGVEPILQASPQGQTSSILTPWSLSSGGGDTGTP
jgi:hypothetical protein